jgi:hypothetical protein
MNATFDFNFTTPTQPTVVDTGLVKICELAPGRFDLLIKLINLLQDSDGVPIRDNIIVQKLSKGTSFIYTDITPVINERDQAGNYIGNITKLNLDILDIKKNIKRLKSLKSNNNIVLYDEPELQRFVVSSGELKVSLPKQLQDLDLSKDSIPSLEGTVPFGKPVTIDGDTANRIRSLPNDKDYYDFLFEEEQLKAIFIPDDVIYTFPEYVNKTSIKETNASLLLRSYAFLLVDGDEYNIAIGKQPNGEYIVITNIKAVTTNIQLYEFVQPITNENLLF